MQPEETTPENQEAFDKAGSETAPDSETQSSAASQDGGRTTTEGSRAPDAPAEGE